MKFTKEKIIGLVGAVVGFVGMFLPFISRSVYSLIKVDLKYMEEFSPDNIIYIVLIAVAAIILFINKFKKPGLIFPAAAVGLVLYDGLINLNSEAAKTIKAAGGTTSLGIGFYVMLAGALTILIALFMSLKEVKADNANGNVYNPNNGNNLNTIPNTSEPMQSTQANAWTQPDAPVNNPFVQASQPVVEEPVQPVFEQPTEPVVEEPVQPVFEQPTEPVIEEPVQPVFEQPTEPVIEEPVQPVFEQPAEPVIEEPSRFINSTPEEQVNPAEGNNSNGTDIFYN